MFILDESLQMPQELINKCQHDEILRQFKVFKQEIRGKLSRMDERISKLEAKNAKRDI